MYVRFGYNGLFVLDGDIAMANGDEGVSHG
jgi:hypothetical protein